MIWSHTKRPRNLTSAVMAGLDFGPFLGLSEAGRARLAAAAEPVHFAAGETLFREDEEAGHAFALLDGRVRLFADGGRTTIAILAAPALVGEMAVLERRRRVATAVADRPVRALRFPAAALLEAARHEPGFEKELAAHAEARAQRTFLRRQSPFADLPSEPLEALQARMRPMRFDPGDVLMRQGDRGDDVYLVRSGELDVIRTEEGRERTVASLGTGAIVGEVAALTGSPRTATVRARTPIEAFMLAGEDVRPVVRRHRAVLERLEAAMRSRHAPRRAREAAISPAPDDPGAVILHDAASGAYLRVGKEALAIYEDLDGERTLRDLAMRHFARTGRLDPHGVFTAVAALQAAGFATAPRIAGDEPDARLMRAADLVLAPRYELPDADRLATALHRVAAPLFTPLGAAVAVTVGILGVISFIPLFRLASPGDFGVAGFAVAFVTLLVAGLGHEAAHAVATKAEGRRLGKAGIGLLWFTPVIYVDTSDTWFIERHRRVRVNAAGPLFNFALAGIFGLLARVTADVVQDLALWGAFANLVSVVFNLSPLLEFDGYYVLADLTNTNALRRKALRFVFRDLLDRPRRPASRTEIGFLAYTVAALVYVVGMSVLVLTGVPGLVAGLLPGRVADELRVIAGLSIAFALTALLLGPFIGEALAARSERRTA